MKHYNRITALLLLLLIISALSGCAGNEAGRDDGSTGGTVSFLVLEDANSPSADAMRAAAEDVTCDTGTPVELLFATSCDDYNVFATEASNALEAGSISGIICGRHFSYFEAISFICDYHGCPLLSLCNCDERITESEHSYLSVYALSPEELAGDMCDALKQQGCKRIAVCYSDSAFENDAVKHLSRLLEQSEIGLAGLSSVKNVSSSLFLTARAWSLMNADALCVLCENRADFPALAVRLRSAGLDIPIIMADDSISGNLTAKEQEAMTDTLFIPEYPSAPNGEYTEEQQQAYNAVFRFGSLLAEGGDSPETVIEKLNESISADGRELKS